jgi:hypothetical protein
MCAAGLPTSGTAPPMVQPESRTALLTCLGRHTGARPPAANEAPAYAGTGEAEAPVESGRLARHALHEVKGGRVWQMPQELRRAALGAEPVHSVRMPHVVAVIRLVQIVVALIALGQRHSLHGIAAGAAQRVFAVAALEGGHEHGLLSCSRRTEAGNAPLVIIP